MASEQHADDTLTPLLLRLNLADYGGRWREQWERLEDPLFTAPVEAVEVRKVVRYWPGGVWPPDGKHYPPNSFTYYADEAVAQGKRKRAPSPLIYDTKEQRERFDRLAHLTGSRVPVISAPWFVNETAVQEGRRVGYYDLLGIQSQADFERVVRFDAKLARDLGQRRLVIFSGITLQPRRLELEHTVLGRLHRTKDSAKALERANPIRVLDDLLEFDATEQFAPLPNGLPAWLLANAKGQTQAKAPDNVVGGFKLGPGNDTQLHINYACWGCHAGMDKGERCVKNFTEARPRRLDALDYEKLRELRRQYQRQVAPLIEADRQGYAAAVREATGWEPYEYANHYTRAWERYEFARIDLVWAARDLGVPAAQLREAFLKAEARPFQLDPVLSLLIDGTIPIRQWEEAIPLAWLVWKRYRP